MPNCDKCHAEMRRLPRAKRTLLQELDGFTLFGDLLYWGQRPRFECSACGNVQNARDGYAMRLLKRLLIAIAIIAAFAGIGAVLSMDGSGVRMPPIVMEVADRIGAHAAVAAFACAGAIVAILWLCLDAARRRR